jgi:hypothetical protein
MLGIGLGILLGRGAVGLVSQTINDLYYTVNVRSVDVDPWTLVKGFGLGLAASLLAALAPAYEATSIPPITALRRSAGEQRVRWLLPRVALAGLVMLAVGAAHAAALPRAGGEPGRDLLCADRAGAGLADGDDWAHGRAAAPARPPGRPGRPPLGARGGQRHLAHGDRHRLADGGGVGDHRPAEHDQQLSHHR